jgi:CBS domain containing-hemolysin-like protein
LSAGPDPIYAPLWAAVAVAILSALFVCADTALTSLSSARLGALAKETHGRRRRALERAASKREVLQGRYVIGRLLALSTSVALYTWWLVMWGGTVSSKLIAAGLGLLTLGVLVQAAAAVGRRSADGVIAIAARWLRPLELLLAPLATLTLDSTRLVTRYRRPRPDPRVSETEMEMMVNERERSGVIPQGPAEMMRNVLEFSELSARDAMIPRTRAVCVEIDTPVEEVLALIRDKGHSRYPVYRGHTDEVVGLLYAKDLFRVVRTSWRPPAAAAGAGALDGLKVRSTLADIIRTPIQIVPESQSLSSLLKDMRQNRQHLAVVVNEFGGMSGIVTLEDVLEEIVGDIQDESDAEEAPIVELGDGRLVADAAVLLCDLSAYLGTDIDPDGKYDSLGGMLTEQLGQVPPVGAAVVAYGMRFVVREADAKRVLKVEIIRPLRPSMRPPGAPSSIPPLSTPSEPPVAADAAAGDASSARKRG